MISNTAQRFIVGIGGILLFVLFLCLPHLHFAAFTLLITGVILVASAEFLSILKQKWLTEYKGLFLSLAGGIPLFFYLSTWTGGETLILFVLPLSLIILFFPHLICADFFESLPYVSSHILGIILVPFSLSHLILIVNMDAGIYYILLLFFTVWGSDTLAYIAGILIFREKRHKIPWKVSPNKSWEGYVSGLLGSLAAVFLVSRLFGHSWQMSIWFLNISLDLPSLKVPALILISTVIFLSAALGDLFESVLKRGVNLKDSGEFLPGHGGLLDRFDSLLVAAPVFYYLLRFLVR